MEKDSAWKEATEAYFPDFLNFFFPDIARAIDFKKGYEFLNKELERIVQDAEIGKRLADILVKVYLEDGSEKWLLIHIEVQGYFEKEFAKRMFIYNYRIFDKYNKDVVSLAILADPLPHFRPDRYEVSYWEFEHKFRFPVVKILDYKEKWAELEKSKNPFAIIVMAHLREMETKQDIDQRLFWKITLVKSLYKKGYSKKDILLLYKFIDWLVSLPEGVSKKFHEEIIKYEEEKKMPYITTAEKIGMEKGMQQGIKQGLLEAIELGLKLKFRTKGLKLYPQITKIDDIDKLRSIKESIEIAKELKEIQELLP